MVLKFFSKCVLAAAVVSLAIAGSMTTSFAAKKKKAAAKPATCTAMTWKATNCANGWCAVSWCGTDGKWYTGPGVCWEPFCPPKG
jgi:uncharacterized low-complexity protein